MTTAVQLAGVVALAAVGWPLVGALAGGARGPSSASRSRSGSATRPLTLALFLLGLVVPYGRATALAALLVAVAATAVVRRAARPDLDGAAVAHRSRARVRRAPTGRSRSPRAR